MTKVCDGCKEIFKTASVNTTFPESGLLFPFRQLGYYDGFTDNEPWDHETEDELMYLCHDCVVKMLDAVPFLYENISKRYGNGLHPTLNEDGTSCCKYCWIPNKKEKQNVN